MENVSIHWLAIFPLPRGPRLRAYSAEICVTTDERRLSGERLRGALDRLADKAGDVGGDEFDAASTRPTH
jgi:hypothetical protein